MIRSLKLVDGGALDYAFKYEDRSALMRLTRQKGICDDILITKDGFITDTSYSNVVLENSEGLFVPHTYLLNGTRRQRLLADGIVQERPIHKRKKGRGRGDLYFSFGIANFVLNILNSYQTLTV